MEHEIATIVSNVGFPIAAFCMMFYMCNTTIKENTRVVSECSELIRNLVTKGDDDK